MSTQLQPQPPSFCNNPSTHLHTLDCGHTVFSSTSNTTPPSPFPSSPTPKSPCSPNCLRAIYTLKPSLPLTWLKHTSLAPFVCPVCVEACMRADYSVLLVQHRESGGRLANATETNIRLWTYAAMIKMVAEGGRMCEGMAGCFAMRDVGAYEGLTISSGSSSIATTIRAGVGSWKMRHGVEAGMGEETEMDGDWVSLVAVLEARYQGHARREGGEVEDLAERLCDARVGLGDGDVEMEDLAEDFGGWGT
ncbi:hypothetical protein CC86DRAFT_439054 [Ophiobolus disseminans]|uniref:Uncharacterized protein n=1 Tax=Ophiobolus disseminans TaxID=1469910 RepID=A0A6A7A4A7_9PLEO|nr:hypothetical protein CC86DRAFT_439054 [Ophiobolus disseminans]